MQALLYEVGRLQALGTISKDLAAELRATASAAARSMPIDMMLEVERLARSERDAIAADDLGPKLEEVSDAQPKQAVRRDAG